MKRAVIFLHASIVIAFLLSCNSYRYFPCAAINDFPQSRNAGQAAVRIHVTNEGAMPLEGVTVQVIGKSIKAFEEGLSNDQGEVSFVLPDSAATYDVALVLWCKNKPRVVTSFAAHADRLIVVDVKVPKRYCREVDMS